MVIAKPFSQYIFLLGGHDLEMQEIRNILEAKGLNFFDFDLEWGAKLSSYSAVFDGEHIFVGIELIVDCLKPDNYIDIDHHNEKSHLPSSIEQVANLLNIELNRWQQLVATNDSGYIPAMESMDASRSEIDKVRELDRKAQGVTFIEETLAKYEINHKLKYIRDIGILKTSLVRFSPLADLLYASKIKLIIYNDKVVNYYGISAKTIAKELFLLDKNPAEGYYGGGDDGFFGVFVGGSHINKTDKTIEMIVEKIGIMQPISVHCFMFPFKWDYKTKGSSIKDTPLKQRINLPEIEKKLQIAGWERKNNYSILESHLYFNEFTYYHDFVREVIFDVENGTNDTDVMRYYSYSLNEKASIKLHVKPFSTNVYDLKLKNLHLHIYNTGVGVLGFDVENHDPETKETDVLIINEYLRRLYPQFISEGFDLAATKAAFLSSKIVVSYDGKTELEEDFSNYSSEKIESTISCNKCFIPPIYISEILKGFEFANNPPLGSEGVFIDHLTDDRMFTICWYGDNNLANRLKKATRKGHHFEIDDWWYCYVFGDKESPSIANKYLKREQINEVSYTRWVEYGTLFGLTRDTFMAVSSDVPTLKLFNAPNLRDHVLTIYYQMVTIGLAQRASVLRFSSEVSLLDNIMKSENDEKLIDRVKELYANYIEFINKIYFREVTSQIQGIELYQLMQKVMNIEKEAKNLDNEISELHAYTSMIQDKKRNEQAHKLNLIASVFLPATFIASLFGIGFIGEKSHFKWLAFPTTDISIALLSIMILGGLGSLLIMKFLKKNKSNKK